MRDRAVLHRNRKGQEAAGAARETKTLRAVEGGGMVEHWKKADGKDLIVWL